MKHLQISLCLFLAACATDPAAAPPSIDPVVLEPIPAGRSCSLWLAEAQGAEVAYGSGGPLAPGCVSHLVAAVACDGADSLTVSLTDAGGETQAEGIRVECGRTIEYALAIACGPVDAYVAFDEDGDAPACAASGAQLNPCPALPESAFVQFAPGGDYLYSTYELDGADVQCVEDGL